MSKTYSEVTTETKSSPMEAMIRTMPEFSVSEVTVLLKKTMEEKFRSVRVRGEISGLKVAPSGHVYFSLKDQNALLSGVCWKNVYTNLKFKPQEGMEVVCSGSISVFAGQSKYQIVVDSLEIAGVGALMQLLEERKKKLLAEGLFATDRKKLLPFLPQTIGVVTSPTGAVIMDILHRLKERFPVRVIIWPVLVQGEKSAEQVTNAISGFNKFIGANKPDLLIVARGGGSLEDLWSFNEEIVVRATAASAIPVISAVGHETDITLIDFAADKRAPTPTAAAEIAVPVREELKINITNYQYRIKNNFYKLLETKRNKLKILTSSLPDYQRILLSFFQRTNDLIIRFDNAFFHFFNSKATLVEKYRLRLKHPQNLININNQKLTLLNHRLKQSVIKIISNYQHQLTLQTSLLNSYNYKKTLERGFVVVRNQDNKLIKSVSDACNSSNLIIEFKDGEITTIPQKN